MSDFFGLYLNYYGPAFDEKGNYLGDRGVIRVELEKGRDFDVNMPGADALLGKNPELTSVKGGVNIPKAILEVIDGVRKRDQTKVQDNIEKIEWPERLSGLKESYGSNTTKTNCQRSC